MAAVIKVGEAFSLRPACPPTEYDESFLQGMVNRMSVSFYKYGKVEDAYPDKIDALACLQERLDSYRETGNTEYLIDAANFAMIEFMCPSVSNARFKPTDADGSNGRVRRDDGQLGIERNEEL